MKRSSEEKRDESNLWYWQSTDRPEIFGVFKGDSEDLYEILNDSKVAPRIAVIDISEQVEDSSMGWQNGSESEEPYILEIEGCNDFKKGKNKKTKTNKDGTEKAPRQLTEYNIFMAKIIADLKEKDEWRESTHKERWQKATELWNLQKKRKRESNYEDY